MKYNRSAFLKSFLWKLLEKGGVHMVTLVVSILLARWLYPEDYGIIALIIIFIALAEVISDGGFNTALIQKKDADKTDFSTIFYVSLGVSVILYLILFFSAPLISGFYGMESLTKVIRILSLSLPFYAFNSIQRAYVAKEMLFDKQLVCSLIAAILSGLIGCWMALKGLGVWALVAQKLSNQVFISLTMWFAVKWRPILSFSVLSFKSLFGFGWKIFLTNFIVTLFVKIRHLVIGKMFSPSSLAYFERGDQFPSFISDNMIAAIQSVLLPTLSEQQDERTRVKSMMRRSTKSIALVICPLMVGLIVVAKPLTILLLTEKWLPIVPFIQIMCISNIFKPLTISNAEAIKAMGYSDITLKLELFKKAIDIIILVVSCCFGLKAIACGVALYNFLCIFINLYPNIKLLDYKISEQIMDVLPSYLTAAVMGLSIYWVGLLDLQPILILVVQAIFGGIVYLAVNYLFKVESFMYYCNWFFKKNS